ncbi:MAG: hypothetical protein ACYC1U_08355 [Candidatus Aquicultorales bacterium]
MSNVRLVQTTHGHEDRDMKEVTLYLGRVHCADCVRDLIEGMAGRLEGVRSASFEESDSSLKVLCDPSLDKSRLRSMAEEYGYEVLEAPGPGKTTSLANAVIIGAAVLILVVVVILLQRA